MTNDRPRLDPVALAAHLRRWAIAFAVWLAGLLGEGSLCRSLRAWAHAMLDAGERGAEGLVVLAALKALPAPGDLSGRTTLRPLNAPRGFARVAVRGADMRRMTRHLFTRERDVERRARRLGAFLGALGVHAQRLARRIARPRPATRLAMAAVPADPIAVSLVIAPSVDDTS